MSQIPETIPSLRKQLENPNTTIEEVQRYLESLDFDARLAACMTLGRKHQRRLFQLAVNTPCTLDDLVPADVAPGVEVILEGKNTLPIFTRFQKRFCRPKDGSPVLYGYNEGFTRKFIGPGYFVAHMTDVPPSEANWPERGASVVNYFMVPPSQEDVVEGWPKVVPNSRGLQMFVYKGTRDFMRKVTSDVTIGEAFKGDKSIDNFFMLVRRPIGQ